MLIVLVFIFYLVKLIVFGTLLNADDYNSYIAIAINDGVIVLCVILSFYISIVFSRLARLIKFTLVSVVFFYVLDFFIMYLYNGRLYFSDVVTFYNDIIISDVPFEMALVFIVFCFLGVIFVRKKDKNVKYLKNKIFISSLILIVMLYIQYSTLLSSSIRAPFFKNYIMVNVNATYKKEYTPEFASNFNFTNTLQCQEVNSIEPKNIIIFILESWSYTHSEWFGEQNNWTPKLDMLAKKNISLKNFYSNGFSTESGLYAFLTGNPMIPYGSSYSNSGGFDMNLLNSDGSILNNLKKLNYNSIFLTSTDLSFLDKGKWLASLGFDRIIGSEHFKEADKKYLFSSTSDEVLFERIPKLLLEKEKNFLVVENVNTHSPFYYPNGNVINKSEEFAFKYVDEKMVQAINGLVDEGNMIIVASDHRVMKPITDKEVQVSNRMASSRVPAFIIWENKTLVSDDAFQQSDLLPSLIDVMTGKKCSSSSRGVIFPFENMAASECIYHARGDERSIVSVMCEGNQFDVLLDGDNTRSLKPIKYNKLSVNFINALRLSNQN